jgi:hypothetical protein
VGAINLYSKALEQQPANAVLFANRAFAHIKIEEYGSAVADASKAVESDPSYAKVCVRVWVSGWEGVCVCVCVCVCVVWRAASSAGAGATANAAACACKCLWVARLQPTVLHACCGALRRASAGLLPAWRRQLHAGQVQRGAQGLQDGARAGACVPYSAGAAVAVVVLWGMRGSGSSRCHPCSALVPAPHRSLQAAAAQPVPPNRHSHTHAHPPPKHTHTHIHTHTHTHARARAHPHMRMPVAPGRVRQNAAPGCTPRRLPRLRRGTPTCAQSWQSASAP